MKNSIQFAALLAVLLGSTLVAPSANAQGFYFDSDHRNGMGWHHDRDDWFGWNRGSEFRARELSRQILSLRADINGRLAAGRISPNRAASLVARLDNLSAQEQMMLSDGRLTGAEMARLQARLTNIRIAANTSFRYY